MPNKYSDCYFCDGEVDERQINREIWWHDQLYVIKDVPLGVCRQCGQKVILPHVAKKIDKLLSGDTPPDEIMQVPSYNFEESETAA